MEVKIRCCGDCFLMVGAYYYAACTHPDAGNKDLSLDDIEFEPPKWCPLKDKEFTLTLKLKESNETKNNA